MLFYCESNNHKGTVVFDVFTREDLRTVWEMFAGDTIEWDEKRRASLIEVNNLKYIPYKGPREGNWYRLDSSFWENFKLDEESVPLHSKDLHVLIRIAVTYNSNEEMDFRKYNEVEKELFIDGTKNI